MPILASTLLLCSLAAAQKPLDLLPNASLSGWVKRGGNAAYSIEGKEIVGRSVRNTPNTFLCTEKTYGDFILEFEFKVDPRLNSGVQIRSEVFDQKTQMDWQGKGISIPAGRVHGYQIEIDPDPRRDRWWTGGIYDEARRGWLYPGVLGGNEKAFTDEGRRLFKQGGWNRIKVEAKGSRIKTWLNGRPCAEVEDSVALQGFIALQVHSISDASMEGAEVRWRNIKITDLTPPDNTLSKWEKESGWRMLWDGKSTKGWRGAKLEGFPRQGWKIEKGVLTVLASGGAESAAGGDIVTVDRYSEFELSLDFRITPGANSGIKYFCQPNLDPITGTGAKAATGSAIGLEYQILDDEKHPDAKMGREGNRTLASLYDLMTAALIKRAKPIGEWNNARVVVSGSRVGHWLNRRLVLEYDRGSKAFKDLVAMSKYKTIPGFGEWQDGHILLQDHGNEVSFKNIKIRTPKQGQP